MAITFDNIDGGALAEKFSMALSQIGRNILDPNMDPEAARGMSIELKFKPSKAGAIQVSYGIKTKLAGLAKSETVFLLGQDFRSGRIEMTEYGNNQAAVGERMATVETPPTMGRPYDPETGETLEEPVRGPIDFRQRKTP